MATSGFVRAWNTNAELTRELLLGLPEGGLAARYAPRTRAVASQFAHIHYVRVQNVEKRGPRQLRGRLQAFGRGAEPEHGELLEALDVSAAAMAEVIAAAEAEGKVRSFAAGLPSYVGYHCAHEAHHRGLVIVSLRAAGLRLPKELGYGLWSAWGRVR